MNSHDIIKRPECYDYKYEKSVIERFGPRVPGKVFDSHFHLSPKLNPKVEDHKLFDVWKECTEWYLGGDKIAGGLVMGTPKMFKTKEALDEDRDFACSIAEAHDGFYSGLVVRPQDTAEDADSFIRKYPKLTTLKPYRCYAVAEDTFEADVLTYAPEWMWELANHYGMNMVVHLSHYEDILSHPGNGGQIRELCKKYPRVKVQLAHCAMGHTPDKLKQGLHYIADLDNVWIDAGGIGEALSIIYCVKALGTDRVMYATDGFGYAIDNQTRCFAIGGNFLALDETYDGSKLPPDYRYKPVNPITENLLATFAAGDLLELTESEWEDHFYNTAVKLHTEVMKSKSAK